MERKTILAPDQGHSNHPTLRDCHLHDYIRQVYKAQGDAQVRLHPP